MKRAVCIIPVLFLLTTAVFTQNVAPIMVSADSGTQEVEKLTVSSLDVEVKISGLIAETELTMTFFNSSGRNIAGDLYVPLPEGAVLSGYALDIEGVLVDGVPVEKQKGREVFEKIVRQGIDPGLAEWTVGNTFKTRVFPIPARGSRTVQVRYISDLSRPRGVPTYHLPMNYSDPVKNFTIRVEVVNTELPPVVDENGFSNLRFDKWRSGFTADTELNNVLLNEDLYVRLPPVELRPAAVEKSVDGSYYFSITDADVQLPNETGAFSRSTVPDTITLYWDASGSRSAGSLTSSFDLLTSYFQSVDAPVISVNCVVVRNEAEEGRTFSVRNGNAGNLITFLREIAYDGGTQLGALPKPSAASDFAMLFSDGISNFGTKEPPEFDIPLYVFSDDTEANYSLLKYTAMKNNGEYFNLRSSETEDVVSRIGRPSYNYLGTRVESGSAVEIFPQLPQPVKDVFKVSGKLEGSSSMIVLQYGRNGKVETEHTFRIIRDDAGEGELLRLVWAQDKLNDLLIFPERNAALITDLGKEYGLVTPGTSLIVLDSLDQYVENKIAPPRMLPEMRQQYFKLIAEESKKEEDRQEQKIDTILAWWEERIDWWNTDFKYDPRKDDRKKEGANEMEESYMGGGEDRMSEEMSEMTASESPAPSEAARDSMGAGGDFEAEKKVAEPESDSGPVVEIKPWDPSTPYLEALKEETPNTYYKEYIRQKKEYGSSPAFYLDCADFFFARKMPDIAVRVLSNLAELELENPALLRVLAHRLEQQDYLVLSKTVFEDVLRMRPEEPQSYRDLALVCGRLLEYERAVELLYRVILGQWDRFEQIELVALMEMNNMIRKAREMGRETAGSHIDRRLIKMLDVDVRIVLTWDADLTDMDLWVIEPTGEESYYGYPLTQIGGHLSRDFTGGYGPEEYMLKKALHGKYAIQVDYFSSDAPALTGSVTLQAVIFTDYGRPNEKRQAVTVRLRDSDDMIDVGTIEF